MSERAKGGPVDTGQLIPTSIVALRLGVTRAAVGKLMERNPSFDALVVRRGCKGTATSHLFNWADVRLWAIKHNRWDVATDQPIVRRNRRVAS